MNRLTLIHPSHMYVAATLPLIHQQDLQGQLDPQQVKLDAAREYGRVWKICRPNRSAVDILWGPSKYDPPTALEASSVLTSCETPERRGVRGSSSSMLPHELHDLWPRIFSYLTQETAALSMKLDDTLIASRRKARIACMIDHVLSSSSYDVMDHKDVIARGLKGWQDLHMFVSHWVLVWCTNGIPPPPKTFLQIARKMGLQGCLPPLLHPARWFSVDPSVAEAGYMVADDCFSPLMHDG